MLALIDQARQEKALGVRWSLYRDQQQPELLGALRKLGFLRMQRDRRLLFYTRDKIFLNPETWCLTDSFFCLRSLEVKFRPNDARDPTNRQNAESNRLLLLD